RTDEREDLALPHVERDVVHGDEAAEALHEVVKAKDRAFFHQPATAFTSSMTVSSCVPLVSSCCRSRLGMRPCGLTSMTTTRISPNTRNFSREAISPIPGKSPFCWVRLLRPIAFAMSVTVPGSCGSRKKITKYTSPAPSITPGMLPIPPSTTMTSTVIDTENPKFSGDTSESFAP